MTEKGINNTVKYRTLKEQKAIEKSGRKYQSQHSLWKEYTFSYEAFDLPKTGSIKIMARSEQEAYTKAEKQIQDDGYYHVELY